MASANVEMGSAFQAADSLSDHVDRTLCMAHVFWKHVQHGWVLLAPAVPHCTPDIEPKHFKIGEKSIELRDETVGPTAVELAGKGGVDGGHGGGCEVSQRSTFQPHKTCLLIQ